MAGDAARKISKADAKHHLAFVQRALDAKDDAQREAALGEGFARFGMGFGYCLNELAKLESTPGRFTTLNEESVVLLLRWIGGERLTMRADDDERRVAVGEEMLAMAPNHARVAGIVARAILSLPESHPQRDVKRAEILVRQRLGAALQDDDASSFVSSVIDLLEHGLAAEDEAVPLYEQAALRLPIEGEPQLSRRLDVASLKFHVTLAIQARDAGEASRFEAQSALAHQRADAVGAERSSDRRLRQSRMLLAMLIDVDERDAAAAAAAWAAARSGEAAPDDIDRIVAYHEGRLRLGLGEHETAAQLFAPLIDAARDDYLDALRDADIQDRGEHFSNLATHHAFALGALGRWDESLRALDAARSLRLRQRAWLRTMPRGRTLLRLERELHAHERGAPLGSTATAATPDRADAGDRIHGRVSRHARVYERYRRLLPQLDAAALASPGIAEVAAVLGEHEAVLSIGSGFRGTLAVLVRHGDREQPSRAQWISEWTNGYWMRVMAGDEARPGWLFAIGAPELGLEHATVLDGLLAAVDAELGRWIATAACEFGVRRLTIVAHRALHLLPFWALPSLSGIEIASAPSLAHVVASRAPRPPSSRRAAIVENPTGDLPLAAAESLAVQSALSGAGFTVEHFVHERATEAFVAPALRRVGALHFCGHGRSEPDRDRASALLMHAGAEALGLQGADPLDSLAAAASVWEDDGDGRRHTDIDGHGRLHEIRRDDGTPLERRLEFSATGTLWTLYRDGAPLRSAELWSAGDIGVGARLRRLGVAFLSACETGTRGFEPTIDEYGGLPAALLLTGVGAVVCSLWPVPESLTLLAADLFYRRLAASDDAFDVVAALRESAAALREMPREEARARFLALHGLPLAPAARFMLEAAASRLQSGPERPYAHPVHWAAFFAVGSPQIRFAKGRRHGTAR